MNGYEFQKKFIQELINAGYPEKAIVTEYEISDNSSTNVFDVAVFDLTTNELLSIFEFKLRSQLSDMQLKPEDFGRMQLCLNRLKNTKIQAYFVIVDTANEFKIFKFQNDGDDKGKLTSPIAINDITPYSVLCNKSRVVTIKNKRKKYENAIDLFAIICWACALLLICITVLDLLGCLSISTAQLGLIGAAIALIIMPFSKKLKVLGIEWERMNIEKDDRQC
jgi:hypothetical protein